MNHNLICDDVCKGLEQIPEQSVHSIITSPPYYQLRDYDFQDQIGLEKNPTEYIEKLVSVFSAAKRVLRNDGTVWLNIGDTYARTSGEGYKKGDLLGIPWMLAFALRKDGWFLRSDIIWAKPNPLPGGVTDRPVSSHEYLFLLGKSENYYYDQESIKENAVERNSDGSFKRRIKRDVWTVPVASFKGAHFAVFPQGLVEPCILASTSSHGCCKACGSPYERQVQKTRYSTRPGIHNKVDKKGFANRDSGRHLTDTKTIGWSKTCNCETNEVDKSVVLDVFCGSGTTGVIALRNGRKFIGIDGKQDYLNMAKNRLVREEEVIGVLNASKGFQG